MADSTRVDRDLAWDYTDTVENSEIFSNDFEDEPLLDPQPSTLFSNNYSEVNGRILTSQQLKHIINNLETSRTILKNVLHERAQHPTDPRPSTPDGAESVSWRFQASLKRCWHWVTVRFFGIRVARFSRFLFLFTIIIQVVNLSVISIIDGLSDEWKQESHYLNTTGAIMITFQVINLLLLMLATAHLTRQVLHQRVSTRFLIQAYLATIFVFTGLYTLTYRLKKKSWRDISEDLSDDHNLIIDLYIRMLYLSISSATLSGASPIKPREWYNFLLLSIQMLFSFVYFAQILAMSMSCSFSRSSESRSRIASTRSRIRSGSGSSQGSQSSARDLSQSISHPGDVAQPLYGDL